MFNLGFGGQFGGGFLQAPDATVITPQSGVVTYAINWTKQRARDDSQRRDRYGGMDSWRLAFPTSPGGMTPDDKAMPLMLTSPTWFHPGAGWRERRYR